MLSAPLDAGGDQLGDELYLLMLVMKRMLEEMRDCRAMKCGKEVVCEEFERRRRSGLCFGSM